MTASAWPTCCAPLGYAPVGERRGGRSGRAQHLPHPREGGGEGLFRDRPAARASERRARRQRPDHRRRRLRRPGRRRGDRPRAQPAVDIVVGPQAYHRLPELQCAQDAARRPRRPARRLDTDIPAETKFDALPARATPVRAGRLPHRAGRLRQVLHLLRRALYARRGISRGRSTAMVAEARALVDGGRARNHAARPERQRLSRRSADGSTWSLGAADPARSPRSTGWRASATPPAIRATWTTT